MRKASLIVLAGLLLSMIIIAGCGDDSKEAYNQAIADGTIDAYKMVINKFPKSEYADLAANEIKALRAEQKKKEEALRAEQRRIKSNPQGLSIGQNIFAYLPNRQRAFEGTVAGIYCPQQTVLVKIGQMYRNIRNGKGDVAFGFDYNGEHYSHYDNINIPFSMVESRNPRCE